MGQRSKSLLRSRGGVDGVRRGKVNSEKAMSGWRKSGMSPPSPPPGARYFRCCHFLALGRKKVKRREARAQIYFPVILKPENWSFS